MSKQTLAPSVVQLIENIEAVTLNDSIIKGQRGRGSTLFFKQNTIINKISQKELNAIAAKELSQPMEWIVVGDGQVIRAQLSTLDLEIVDYTLAK